MSSKEVLEYLSKLTGEFWQDGETSIGEVLFYHLLPVDHDDEVLQILKNSGIKYLLMGTTGILIEYKDILSKIRDNKINKLLDE